MEVQKLMPLFLPLKAQSLHYNQDLNCVDVQIIMDLNILICIQKREMHNMNIA